MTDFARGAKCVFGTAAARATPSSRSSEPSASPVNPIPRSDKNARRVFPHSGPHFIAPPQGFDTEVHTEGNRFHTDRPNLRSCRLQVSRAYGWLGYTRL